MGGQGGQLPTRVLADQKPEGADCAPTVYLQTQLCLAFYAPAHTHALLLPRKCPHIIRTQFSAHAHVSVSSLKQLS